MELDDLANAVPFIKDHMAGFLPEEVEQASIQVKYDTYIQKERELVARMGEMEDHVIPESFDYSKLASLGNEAREKLI